MPEAIVLLTFKKERGTCRMAEKDIAEKILEDYPDVFADIVNGLLFDGKTVIRPEELEVFPGVPPEKKEDPVRVPFRRKSS